MNLKQQQNIPPVKLDLKTSIIGLAFINKNPRISIMATPFMYYLLDEILQL